MEVGAIVQNIWPEVMEMIETNGRVQSFTLSFRYRRPNILNYCNHIDQITVLLPNHTFHKEIEHNLVFFSETTSLIKFWLVQNSFKTFTAMFITFLVLFESLFSKFCLIYISEPVHLYGRCSRHNISQTRPF